MKIHALFPVLVPAAILSLAGPSLAQGQRTETLKLRGQAESQRFGSALAARGSLVLVGNHNDGALAYRGGSATLVDFSNPLSPVILSTFRPADPQADAHFGTAVVLDGHLALVGATGHRSDGQVSGAAYVLDVSDPASPQYLATISGSGDADRAGETLALGADAMGTLAAVGIPSSLYIGELVPRVEVYDLADPEAPVLLASIEETVANSAFASALDMDGGVLAVGASNELGRGAVRLYDARTGAPRATLHAQDAAPGDAFGAAVAIEGDLVLVAAPFDDDAGSRTGAVYAFDLEGNQLAKFLPSDAAGGSAFGIRATLREGVALIGATAADPDGAAYLIDFTDPANPVELDRLVSSDPGSGGALAHAVALTGNAALVGKPLDGDAAPSAGALYAYTLGCSADFDGDGALTIFDFLAFQAAFDAGDARADLDGDGSLTIFDFLVFGAAFDAGC